MIVTLPHIWWDHMIYEHENSEILEAVLENKRRRETSDTVLMAGNELATNLITLIDEGKET